ncbi:outer membrane protein assembly factor [Aquimarina sp. ERC-38]|uniref:BamA/TamA family outer membrane protein n=1 Tax=Aquimarina sp. ERC-38 TaxID=2949996 RepID=UPI0022467D1E|nr:BamA/TamA family outer membrane protein [Aquimarina sp. ERC-38]UZO81550.1 outer membrane protein assembly factor [Aquimarina sp. ERC-38]
MFPITKYFQFRTHVFAFIFLITLTTSNAQDFDNFKEFFTFHPNKKAAAADSTLYPSKFITAPVVSFSPETSLGFGIGAKYLFKFRGSGKETRTSNMPITLQYTLNNQFILFSGFEIFTNQEKWVITGNVTVQNYPRLYYGIGRDTSEDFEEEYNYFQALVEPILLKQAFTRYLFLGGGLRYNHIFNVEVEEEGQLAATMPEGFDGSTSVGVELAALYDNRNNILNAKQGWYLELTHGFYGKVLGGTNEFQLTRFDLRHYISPFKKNNDVIGFQFKGHFSHKDVPFSELGLLGSSEILRGYREGRYVERNLLAGQVEYRKHFKNTRWGMVAFAGAGDVYGNLNEFKINNLRPNFGVGVRFLLDKVENLNIRVDWGFGDASNNVYLNIAEAF